MGDTFDMAAWITSEDALPIMSEGIRASLAYTRILDKPSSVTFRDASGVELGAQTVRIEPDNGTGVALSAAGVAPRRTAVVYGIRNHPSLPDTDVGEGYRFVYLGDHYRVWDVVITIGEVQAMAEVIG